MKIKNNTYIYIMERKRNKILIGKLNNNYHHIYFHLFLNIFSHATHIIIYTNNFIYQFLFSTLVYKAIKILRNQCSMATFVAALPVYDIIKSTVARNSGSPECIFRNPLHVQHIRIGVKLRCLKHWKMKFHKKIAFIIEITFWMGLCYIMLYV